MSFLFALLVVALLSVLVLDFLTVVTGMTRALAEGFGRMGFSTLEVVSVITRRVLFGVAAGLVDFLANLLAAASSLEASSMRGLRVMSASSALPFGFLVGFSSEDSFLAVFESVVLIDFSSAEDFLSV